jgi:hypothetical protein
VTQSATLASFFERFGGLDDLAEEVFPVSLGRHSLEVSRFRLEPDPPTGDDTLIGDFNLLAYDMEAVKIVRIVEQSLKLLHLPPALADDVYRVRGFRVWVDPETVKTRLRRFLRGLERAAKFRYAAVKDDPDLCPGALL